MVQGGAEGIIIDNQAREARGTFDASGGIFPTKDDALVNPGEPFAPFHHFSVSTPGILPNIGQVYRGDILVTTVSNPTDNDWILVGKERHDALKLVVEGIGERKAVADNVEMTASTEPDGTTFFVTDDGGTGKWGLYQRIGGVDVKRMGQDDLASAILLLTQVQATSSSGVDYTTPGLVSAERLDQWGVSRRVRRVFNISNIFDFTALGYANRTAIYVRNSSSSNGADIIYGVGGSSTLNVTRANGVEQVINGQNQFNIQPSEIVFMERDGLNIHASIIPGERVSTFQNYTSANTAGPLPHDGIVTIRDTGEMFFRRTGTNNVAFPANGLANSDWWKVGGQAEVIEDRKPNTAYEIGDKMVASMPINADFISNDGAIANVEYIFRATAIRPNNIASFDEAEADSGARELVGVYRINGLDDRLLTGTGTIVLDPLNTLSNTALNEFIHRTTTDTPKTIRLVTAPGFVTTWRNYTENTIDQPTTANEDFVLPADSQMRVHRVGNAVSVTFEKNKVGGVLKRISLEPTDAIFADKTYTIDYTAHSEQLFESELFVIGERTITFDAPIIPTGVNRKTLIHRVFINANTDDVTIAFPTGTWRDADTSNDAKDIVVPSGKNRTLELTTLDNDGNEYVRVLGSGSNVPLVDGYMYSGVDVANSSFGSGAISFNSGSFNTIYDPKGLVDAGGTTITIDDPRKAGAYMMALNVTSGSVAGRVGARVNGITRLIASGEDSQDSDGATGIIELVEGDVVSLQILSGGTTYGVSFTMMQVNRFIDETQYVSADQVIPTEDADVVLINTEGVDNTFYGFSTGETFAQIKANYENLRFDMNVSRSGTSVIRSSTVVTTPQDLQTVLTQSGYWFFQETNGSAVTINPISDAHTGFTYQQVAGDAPTGLRMKFKVTGMKKRKRATTPGTLPVDQTGIVAGDLYEADGAGGLRKSTKGLIYSNVADQPVPDTNVNTYAVDLPALQNGDIITVSLARGVRIYDLTSRFIGSGFVYDHEIKGLEWTTEVVGTQLRLQSIAGGGTQTVKAIFINR